MNSRFVVSQLRRLEMNKVALEKRLAVLEAKFANEEMKFNDEKTLIVSQLTSIEDMEKKYKESDEKDSTEVPPVVEPVMAFGQ